MHTRTLLTHAFGLIAGASLASTAQLLQYAFQSTGGPSGDGPRYAHSSSAIRRQRMARDYNFTTAVCAIAKDAEPYLTEWVDYHLLAVGFDYVFVYDNTDDNELGRWHNNTRSHPVYSRVEIIHHPGHGYLDQFGKHVQKAAYGDCVRRFGADASDPSGGARADYFAMIDLDEFVFPVRGDTIKDVLAEYLVPYGGSLTMNWVLFGTANRTVYSPAPVLRRFQYRDPDVHNVIKSIVAARDFGGMRNPHAASLKGNASARTTLRPGAPHEAWSEGTGASDGKRPSSVLLLHHVRYTSVKEYRHKRCVRGSALHGAGPDPKGCDVRTGRLSTAEDAKRGDVPDHLVHRPGLVFDDGAWRLLTRRVPRYRTYDDAGWEDYF